jgi:hypothetical protein
MTPLQEIELQRRVRSIAKHPPESTDALWELAELARWVDDLTAGWIGEDGRAI